MKIRGLLSKLSILLLITSIIPPVVSTQAQEKVPVLLEENERKEEATQDVIDERSTNQDSTSSAPDSKKEIEEPSQPIEAPSESNSEKKMDEVTISKESSKETVEEKKHSVEENKSIESSQTPSSIGSEKGKASSLNGVYTRSEVMVNDETAFRNALRNKAITKINITADFTITSGYADFVAENRSLVIEGNGNTIDFRGMTVLFNTTGSNPLRIEVRDLDMLGQNFYGPIRMYGVRGTGSILYHNITYTGAQMTASYEANIEISGHVKVDTVLSYTALTGATISTQGSGQQNVEATNMRFLAGSHYRGTTINSGAFELYSGGSVYVERDATIEVSSSGVGGETPSATIEADGNFYIAENAVVQVSSTHDSNRGGLALGADDEIIIEKGASLSIKSNGRLAYPGLSIGDRAKFIVRDQAEFDIQSTNQGTATLPSIRTGVGSTFLIGDQSSFHASTDGSGSKNLIYIGGSSSFQFANAKRVNLQLDNSNPSSRLLYMVNPSNWKVDVQSIKAWTSNVWDGDTNENFGWSPMFGMNISYSGSNVIKAEGQSVDPQIAERFRTDFRTQNFRRVLFDFIPNVMIDLNSLSDDKNKENSHILIGVASPYAYIRFSGDIAIPAGNIPSPIHVEENYHVRADENGLFTFSLPDNQFLTASNTVKAYAFLDGKSHEDKELIRDETAPGQPVLDNLTDQSITMEGTADPFSTIMIYDEKGQNVGTALADQNGKYSYDLVENQLPLRPRRSYHVIAIDKSGNRSEQSEIIFVIDTMPPEARTTLKKVKTGYVLPEDYRTLFDFMSDNDEDGEIKIEIEGNPKFENIGYLQVRFKLSDASGNSIFIDIPFFVSDDTVVLTDSYAFSVRDEVVWSWKEVPEDQKLLIQKLVKDSELKVWDLNDGTLINEGFQIDNENGVPNTPGVYQVNLLLADLKIPIPVEVRDGGLVIDSNFTMLDYGTQKIRFMTTLHQPINNPSFTITDDRKNMASWRLTAKLAEGSSGESGFGIYQEGEFTKLVADEETLAFHQQKSQSETTIDLSLLQFKQTSDIKGDGSVEDTIHWILTDAP